MATLSQKMELARDLFSREPQAGEARTYAPAVAASSNGTVRVDMGGEVIAVPTVGAVEQGDEVLIQVQGGHPVAIGARGSGDKIISAIDAMQDTLSYVWLDEYGQLRITPEPQDQDPDTGVMINANGVNVVGYTYATHTGDNGFTVTMGGDEVLQVIGNAQQPDFNQNIIRSEDVLQLHADTGADVADGYRTALRLIEPDTAQGYYTGDALELDTAGYRVLQAGRNAITGGAYLTMTGGASRMWAGTVSGNRGTFNNHKSSFYGTCSTAAATQAKEVECDEFDATTDLVAGTVLYVQFTNAQTYNGQPTLSVNYSSAVPVVLRGTTAGNRYMWLAGELVAFVYDGSAWCAIDHGLATTTYYGVTKLTSSVASTSTSLAATASAVKQAYDLAAAGGTDTGWLELVAPSGTSNGIHYRVVGKMCTIVADGTYTTSTTSGWVTIGTLPTAYRPTGAPHALRFIWYDHARSEFRRGQVTTGGNVQLHQSGTADGCEFTFSFPIG